MSLTFREFVNKRPFELKLREDEAAPAVGNASAPSNPNNTTNKYHFDSLERGLGMDPDGMDAALTGNSITIWRVPNYFRKWGFLVSGPVDVSIAKSNDGNYVCT
jgi:hypothetical protein